MVATLRYSIGRKVLVPVSQDRVAQLSEGSMQEAIAALLDQAGPDADGTVNEIRETVKDARAVIEVRTGGQYAPVSAKAPLKDAVKDLQAFDVQVNRPHAGG